MKNESYSTLAGEVIEYPKPEGELAAFLARVFDAAHDPRVSESEMLGLIYGKDNPLLDQTIFKDQGAVTREAFANPLYHVMIDLLGRKRVAVGSLNMAQVAAAASMTVTEAARELGVSSSAVRQAIAAHRIAAIKTTAGYLLDPRDVANFAVSGRGPTREPAVLVRFGNEEGKSFRVKAPAMRVTRDHRPKGDGTYYEGEVRSFRRMAVAFSGKEGNRMFVLEPSEESTEFKFGPFFIRGRYNVVEKVNNPAEAAARFKAFVPVRTQEDRTHRQRTLRAVALDLQLGPEVFQAVTAWDGGRLAIYETDDGHGRKNGWAIDFVDRAMKIPDNLARELVDRLNDAWVDFQEKSFGPARLSPEATK